MLEAETEEFDKLIVQMSQNFKQNLLKVYLPAFDKKIKEEE